MIGVDDLMGTLKLTDFMEISLNEKILVNLTVPTRTVFTADSVAIFPPCANPTVTCLGLIRRR